MPNSGAVQSSQQRDARAFSPFSEEINLITQSMKKGRGNKKKKEKKKEEKKKEKKKEEKKKKEKKKKR